MRILQFVLLLNVLFLTYAEVERPCSCTLSTLWVDVAVVIDISAGMGNNGLIEVISDVSTVFGSISISQDAGQYTRVGVVTYDSKAYINYNLTYFTSRDQFEKEIWNIIPTAQITNPDSVVKFGLETASKMLSASKQPNRKQVVLLYASSYSAHGENSPTQFANSLKSSGVCIITVPFSQRENLLLSEGLRSLACSGMFVDPNLRDPVGPIQRAMCQVNCYCSTGWGQYVDNYDNPKTKYGECIKFGANASSWSSAKESCHKIINNGFLATAASEKKINYLSAKALNTFGFAAPHTLHVGLEYTGKKWQWEQSSGFVNAGVLNWLSDYPTQPDVNACGMMSPAEATEAKFGLINVDCSRISTYACQVASCDTDNYCS